MSPIRLLLSCLMLCHAFICFCCKTVQVECTDSRFFPGLLALLTLQGLKSQKEKNVYLTLSICQFIQICRASLYLQRYNLWQRGLLKAEYVDTFVSTSFCIMGQLTKHTVSVVNRSEATTRVQYQQGRA